MAHHDDSFAIYWKSLVELVVALLQIVDAAIENVELFSVLCNQLSVIRNVLIVDIDVLVIAVNVLSGGLHTLLKTLDSFAKSLSANKHVTGLGNLQLISVLTEQRTVSVERIDSFGELGGIGVSGWSRLVTTVMVMGVIIIVVMIIELVVFVLGDGALWVNTSASLLGMLSLLLLVGLDLSGILVASMVSGMGLLLELLNLGWV